MEVLSDLVVVVQIFWSPVGNPHCLRAPTLLWSVREVRFHGQACESVERGVHANMTEI